MRELSLTNNNFNHQTMIVEMGELSAELLVERLGSHILDALYRLALVEMFTRSEVDLLLL